MHKHSIEELRITLIKATNYDIPDFPITPRGWGNGYVTIPDWHPLFNVHYNDIEQHIEVHGGITYSDSIRYGTNDKYSMWQFGFDTNHGYETPENDDVVYVEKETVHLREQLWQIYLDSINETEEN